MKTQSAFRDAYRNLKWYEWVMFSAMILIGGHSMLTDATHPLWYLIVNYVCSILGVCCIFLCAHASWPNWIFAVLNTALYIVVLYYNKVYGTMMLELAYYMPTNIMGLLAWRKHLDETEADKCRTRIMSIGEKFVMAALVAAGTIICHSILIRVGGATAWLDAMTVAIGIIATYYEIKRYADQYYLWIITDVIAVIQWVILADVIMLTKKSIYLIMAVIGLINWRRMQRERNHDNV